MLVGSSKKSNRESQLAETAEKQKKKSKEPSANELTPYFEGTTLQRHLASAMSKERDSKRAPAETLILEQLSTSTPF